MDALGTLEHWNPIRKAAGAKRATHMICPGQKNRNGYASTLHKVQGATLEHITVWLDVRNMPAAAYVALSRVEFDANWRYVGNPGVHHFTPARF